MLLDRVREHSRAHGQQTSRQQIDQGCSQQQQPPEEITGDAILGLDRVHQAVYAKARERPLAAAGASTPSADDLRAARSGVGADAAAGTPSHEDVRPGGV